jgi:hypothetical protein
MLVDGGAAVNLMSYSIFKKLERKDDELMKTNLTLNDNGGNSMEARGVISMELTIGSKSLATAFFVVEVQGNLQCYSWLQLDSRQSLYSLYFAPILDSMDRR